jgi:hypothetical protein
MWVSFTLFIFPYLEENKGNANRGVSPRLQIWPSDLDQDYFDFSYFF